MKLCSGRDGESVRAAVPVVNCCVCFLFDELYASLCSEFSCGYFSDVVASSFESESRGFKSIKSGGRVTKNDSSTTRSIYCKHNYPNTKNAGNFPQ